MQGLAEGLGVKERVVSPTYALEQRYSDLLSHMDLYRLSEKQAKEFIATLDVFPGIRAVEWSNRHDALEHGIAVEIKELSKGREVTISFSDLPIPSDKAIDAWRKEVRLPKHIIRHTEAVAEVAGRLADELMKQGTVVRKNALLAAAKAHDLLRFVDFQSWDGDEMYTPVKEDIPIWTTYKEKYGAPHEKAAELFLREHGFAEIGTMIRPHRGYSPASGETIVLKTIEQKVLAYSDKRVRFDEVVSLDDRFDDFVRRYGDGKESDHGKGWREFMKKLEEELFPGGAPF